MFALIRYAPFSPFAAAACRLFFAAAFATD